jgi:hypothetical protein
MFAKEAALKGALDIASKNLNEADARDKRRLAEIDRLSKELAKALKNDTAKDAKTGKFTKKAKA